MEIKLEEKYISQNEAGLNPDPSRITLSNDAYAVCEFIEILKNNVELLRRTILKNG